MPQSFLPALATPGAFSIPLWSSAATAFEPAVASPTASRVAMAERMARISLLHGLVSLRLQVDCSGFRAFA